MDACRPTPHMVWHFSHCKLSESGGKGHKEPEISKVLDFSTAVWEARKVQKHPSKLQRETDFQPETRHPAESSIMCEGEIKRTGLLQLTSRQCFSRSYCGWAPIPNKAQTGRKGSRSWEKRKAEVPAAQHTEGAPSEAWTTQNRFTGPFTQGPWRRTEPVIPPGLWVNLWWRQEAWVTPEARGLAPNWHRNTKLCAPLWLLLSKCSQGSSVLLQVTGLHLIAKEYPTVQTHHVSSTHSIDISVVPAFWLLWITLWWTLVYKLQAHVFSPLSWVHAAGWYGNSMINHLRNRQTVLHSWGSILYFTSDI